MKISNLLVCFIVATIMISLSSATVFAQVSENIPCDSCNPCSGGLECFSFPGETGSRCAEPDPCSYYQCPSNHECKLYTATIAMICPDGTLAGNTPDVVCECVGPLCTVSSGDTQTVEYNVSSGKITITKENIVRIEDVIIRQVVEGNRGILDIGGVSAKYFGELTIEESALVMKTSAGNKIINIMPEEVSGMAEEVTQVTQVELKEESQKPVYSVTGTKPVKILGFIPVELEIKTKISAETADVISVHKPWWGFLAW